MHRSRLTYCGVLDGRIQFVHSCCSCSSVIDQEHVSPPSSPQQLTFVNGSDQSLENEGFLIGLQTLIFGNCFNQSMENVSLPSDCVMSRYPISDWIRSASIKRISLMVLACTARERHGFSTGAVLCEPTYPPWPWCIWELFTRMEVLPAPWHECHVEKSLGEGSLGLVVSAVHAQPMARTALCIVSIVFVFVYS